MTAPVTSFATRRAGVRQAIVDADIVGRSVFHPANLDDARAPYIVLTDGDDVTPQLSGDAGVLGEATTGEARLYQRNARDADPNLAPRITAALHGARFTVGNGATARRVFLRAQSPTTTEAEGLMEQVVRWTAYSRPGVA